LRISRTESSAKIKTRPRPNRPSADHNRDCPRRTSDIVSGLPRLSPCFERSRNHFNVRPGGRDYLLSRLRSSKRLLKQLDRCRRRPTFTLPPLVASRPGQTSSPGHPLNAAQSSQETGTATGRQ
jgi:hypothetical protein